MRALFRERLRKKRDTWETYEVVTQDGYILQIIDRVAGSKKSPLCDKTAVLLLHGILDCLVTWVVAGSEVGSCIAK